MDQVALLRLLLDLQRQVLHLDRRRRSKSGREVRGVEALNGAPAEDGINHLLGQTVLVNTQLVLFLQRLFIVAVHHAAVLLQLQYPVFQPQLGRSLLRQLLLHT